jgi:hypothetical protein
VRLAGEVYRMERRMAGRDGMDGAHGGSVGVWMEKGGALVASPFLSSLAGKRQSGGLPRAPA